MANRWTVTAASASRRQRRTSEGLLVAKVESSQKSKRDWSCCFHRLGESDWPGTASGTGHSGAIGILFAFASQMARAHPNGTSIYSKAHSRMKRTWLGTMR